MATRTWHCGHGHTFQFGNEDWHYEQNQGLLPDGAPIPMYCTEYFDSLDDVESYLWGEPCMDSSSLIYD